MQNKTVTKRHFIYMPRRVGPVPAGQASGPHSHALSLRPGNSNGPAAHPDGTARQQFL